MTSFAGYYNRRHERSGHLFQNRYKSYICEEDPYFLELVRYIHLNPLRSGLVQDFEKLDRYPWCGYGVLMGRYKNSWQEIDEVLKYFGTKVRRARMNYRSFMEEGIPQGRRPDLAGGGLIRSAGGRGRFFQMQKQEFKDLYDQRVLKSGNFVRKVLETLRSSEETNSPRLTWENLIKKVGNWSKLSAVDITSGSKRPEIARARAILSYLAARKARMKTTDVAAYLNVSQSAISKCLLKGEKTIKKNPQIVEQTLDKS